MSGYVNIVRNPKHAPSTFDPFAKPENDMDRVLAMQRFEIFDTPSEEIFSTYTELAALTFGTPIALMSFVGDDHVFYKESFGVARTGQVVERKNSPCTIAILNKEVTVFRYALADPCVLADEKNLNDIGYKFYAGAPLVTKDGFSIGMLAIVDKLSREYTEDELNRLKEMAAEVMMAIEYRLDALKNNVIKDLNEKLRVLHLRVAALRPGSS